MTPPNELIDDAIRLYDDQEKALAVLITVVTLIDHPDSDAAAKWQTLADKLYEITGTAPVWEATFNALRRDFGGFDD
jgi:hypothetical protein